MSQNVVLILFQVLALIMAFSVHECAHAWTASRLGDPTARMLGRVTLNPLKHLDPFGSVILPLLMLFTSGWVMGWAKPTPVTPQNFRNYKRDDILVSLAGPASNLLLAVAALIGLLFIKVVVPHGDKVVLAAMEMPRFHGIPVQNLSVLFPVALLLYFVILINLLLFVFNLIPFPPLDGSHILRHFLPYSLTKIYDRMGIFALLIFMYFAGRYIFPIFLDPLQSAFDTILRAL